MAHLYLRAVDSDAST